MNLSNSRKTQGSVGRTKILLLTLPLLVLNGCVSPKLNNTDRLINHPEFKSAVIAAPNFVEDALKTIADLERDIESR